VPEADIDAPKANCQTIALGALALTVSLNFSLPMSLLQPLVFVAASKASQCTKVQNKSRDR
jgi:hypothetical protein